MEDYLTVSFICPEEIKHSSCPERNLVAAVLDRANRDLGLTCDVEPFIRKRAILWFKFKSDENVEQLYITFKQCAEVLDLSPSRIRELERRVKLAEYLYACGQKCDWSSFEAEGERKRA